MAGLSIGVFETRLINLNRPDVFSHYALFSGVVYTPEELQDIARFDIVFISSGAKERPDAVKSAIAEQRRVLIAVSGPSQGTAHDFHTWRSNLYELAPLLFQKRK